jgi:hypothetical protein
MQCGLWKFGSTSSLYCGFKVRLLGKSRKNVLPESVERPNAARAINLLSYPALYVRCWCRLDHKEEKQGDRRKLILVHSVQIVCEIT